MKNRFKKTIQEELQELKNLPSNFGNIPFPLI